MKRILALSAATLTACLLLVQVANAATIKATYTASFGSYGGFSVRRFTDGTGSATLKMAHLTSGRAYTFSLAKGRCTGSTTLLIPAQGIKVSPAGTVSRSWPLSGAQMSKITPRLTSASAVAILLSGTSRLCRTLVSTSATPAPTPTPSPVTGTVSAHRFGYGPLLTPSSMVDWFPKLKVGVVSSATATVTVGQNVYALLVVPPGGSLTFTITTSSGSGGWYWKWDPQYNYWDTPEHYFYEGQSVSLNGGTIWAYGLDYNTYAGSETLTIKPTAIGRP